MNVYKFENYKELLRAKIKEFKATRGIVAKMAEAAGCQRSYLSQALNTHVHLTPDHAFGLSEFFGFNSDERNYFLLLVDYGRAGTRALKTHLKQNIEEIQKRNSVLENRLTATVVDPTEAHYKYYASWIWAAVHIGVSVPELRTVERLSKHLSIPESFVESTLQGLSEMGLVHKAGHEWKYVEGERHLSHRSALSALHHANWRSRAALAAQLKDERSYFYTGVSSASREDCKWIRETLLETTEKILKVIGRSKEEELICLNLDLFRV
jgi:uncharacterized protein (TIGR02147 family)